MSQRRPVEHRLSAGGVVVRSGENGPEIVLCGRNTPLLWALPKGTPEPEESHEETALREVNEETGLEVKNDGFLDSIEYWFAVPGGTRVHKKVLFYLMTPVGGDVSLHDDEFDDVMWFTARKALKAMTYPNEVKIVEKGLAVASGRSTA